MSGVAVKVIGLTKVFKDTMAVNRVSFAVQQGSVMGFLGPNGAGKSTTIKMLLNLLVPSDGTSSLLGYPSTNLPAELWERVGYVSEDQKMYGWMTVDQAIRFTAGFYPKWDKGYEAELVKRLELPRGSKVSTLSKGSRGKLALLLALAYHPELLVLDDPVSGLDPLVRHEFLEQIIELLQKEGRTVLFSSHILDEVERIADYIVMIKQGRLVANAPLESLKANMKRVILTFEGAPPRMEVRDALRVVVRDREVHVTFREGVPQAIEELKRYQPKNVVVQDLDLSDMFVELMKGENGVEEKSEVVSGGVK